MILASISRIRLDYKCTQKHWNLENFSENYEGANISNAKQLVYRTYKLNALPSELYTT